MAEQSTNITLGLNRHSLEGSIVYACRNCNAPGCYSNSPIIQQDWPALYDSLHAGQQVGETFPQCGNKRPPNKDMGELTASMPKWLWGLVLSFKWLLITCPTVQAMRWYDES